MRKMVLGWIILVVLTLTLFGCGLFDSNEAPVIDRIEMSKTKAKLGDEVILNVMANDPDDDELTYKYEVSIGSITGSGSMVSWKIEKPIEFVIMDGSEPEVEEEESVHFAKVTVSDGDKSVQESVSITVVPEENTDFGIEITTFGGS